jgi:hypothetical protein
MWCRSTSTGSSQTEFAQLLDEAGLAVLARLLREPDETERAQQAYLLAWKPTTIGDVNDVR